jgi:hypothetical protein
MTQSTEAGGIVEREPVRIFLAGLAGLVDLALIAAAALDWVDLTPEQTTAIVACVTAACLLVSETLRGAVYAPATVDEMTRPLSP